MSERYPSREADVFTIRFPKQNPEDPQSAKEKFQTRMPGNLRERLKQASADNHRAMNSEIVARLLASFDGDAGEDKTMSCAGGRDRVDQFQMGLPDGMRSRLKEQAKANGRSMNSEIVELLEAGLTGDPDKGDRLSRIEAKLDRLLGDAE